MIKKISKFFVIELILLYCLNVVANNIVSFEDSKNKIFHKARPTPSNKPLIDKDQIRKFFSQLAFADSHMASDDFLGAGLFYYTIAYNLKARLCVCLGSGAGFVPACMRQAQRDLNLKNAKTILVDGMVTTNPVWTKIVERTWFPKNSSFRQHYPDVEIINDLTANVSAHQGKNWKIDYLHIDADHSFKGCLADFNDYLKLMNRDSVITLHDTRMGGPFEVVKLIRAQGYEVVNFNLLGCGFALVHIKK
jgi:hypothetical protein